MAALAIVPCVVEGCERAAESGPLCHAHRKRQQRGREMREPVRRRKPDPWLALMSSVLAVANADTSEDADEDFGLLLERLKRDARAWVASEASR